jgi:hypothetical protein
MRLNFNRIEQWYDEPVIVLGAKKITRRQLARDGVVNMKAVAILANYLHKNSIRTPQQLFAEVDPVECVKEERGFGLTTAFVGMHVLSLCGYNPKRWGVEPSALRRVK